MRVLLDNDNKCMGFSRDPLFSGGHDIPLPPEPFNEYIRVGDDWVHSPPPPPLEEAKTNKVQALSEQCHEDITAGFVSMALGSQHLYSSQLEDQINLMGAASIAPEVGTLDYVCADIDGVRQARPHTRAQLQQVYGDGAMHKSERIYRFHLLRAQVEVAETVEAVEAIIW